MQQVQKWGHKLMNSVPDYKPQNTLRNSSKRPGGSRGHLRRAEVRELRGDGLLRETRQDRRVRGAVTAVPNHVERLRDPVRLPQRHLESTESGFQGPEHP